MRPQQAIGLDFGFPGQIVGLHQHRQLLAFVCGVCGATRS
jgi:hypothetical protein